MTGLLTPAPFRLTSASVPVSNLTELADLIFAMMTSSPMSAFVSFMISALSIGFSVSAAIR